MIQNSAGLPTQIQPAKKSTSFLISPGAPYVTQDPQEVPLYRSGPMVLASSFNLRAIPLYPDAKLFGLTIPVGAPSVIFQIPLAPAVIGPSIDYFFELSVYLTRPQSPTTCQAKLELMGYGVPDLANTEVSIIQGNAGSLERLAFYWEMNNTQHSLYNRAIITLDTSILADKDIDIVSGSFTCSEALI